MKLLARILTLAFFSLVLAQQPATAVPAYPGVVEVTQPNGFKFGLRLRGDEFFAWNETEDGYAIVQDPRDKTWKYAKQSRDRAGFDMIPGADVGVANPAALRLKKDAAPNRGLLERHIMRSLKETRGLPRQAPQVVDSPAPSPGTGPVAPEVGIPSMGVVNVRNIVILACFSDHWNGGGGTVLSTKGRTDTSEYVQLFNETGHTADGAVGSVSDYYAECSYGKLSVTTLVTAWVLLPHNEAYYGTDGSSLDTNWKEMITDAVSAANTAGFDFSQGDGDGDGWVDVLTVIHSGHAQEYSGNPATSIWSKQGEINSPVTVDGVQVKRCHTEPGLRGNTSSTGIIRIGVICHEMGHFFGLPDLYDYSNLTHGVGRWCAMGNGSWNGTDGKRPAHFCAYSKYMLGFVSPIEVHSGSAVSIARVEDNPAVHMVRDGTANGEYFLVENRALVGFDNDSAIFPGLLVQHVYSASTNNDIGTWLHPAVKIEEADGDNSLGAKTSYSEAGDVWTSASGLGGGFRDQTANQSTNSMLYQAAHAYNRADNAASYSYIGLNTFSAAGATMTYTASTLRPSVADQSALSPNYTVSWGACTNATKYEIQEGSPVVLTSFSDSAESENAMYENWRLSGTVFRNTGRARTGSYCYSMQHYYDSIWYSAVQSLTSAKSFTVTGSTVISFYILSHLDTGSGYLKCQISNDSEATWQTLGTYSGYIDAWSLCSFNYAALSAAGISVNDTCTLRFVADFEEAYGWSAFPGYGYALEDITIANMGIDGYGNWATLDNNVLTNSHAVSGMADGTYAYRVRAYANGVWQEYGQPGTVEVTDTSVIVTFETDGTAGATLVGDNPQTVIEGGDCSEVEAVAPASHHFVKWTKSGADYSFSNPLTVTNVTEAMTLTANFAINTYTVSFVTDGTAGASISGDASQDVDHGSDCTEVTAVAPPADDFAYWTKDDAFYSAANPLTVTNVTETMTIIARFADTAPPAAPGVSGSASPTTDTTPSWTWVAGGGDGNGTFRYQLDSEVGLWVETTGLSFTPGGALGEGPHTLYVQERDAEENWSSSGSYTVIVDMTAPVITLLGDNPLELWMGDDYVEPGATALDAVDGDLTLLIEIDISDVDMENAGTYVVGYDVTDAAGNGAHAQRTVNVTEQQVPLAWWPAFLIILLAGGLALGGQRTTVQMRRKS